MTGDPADLACQSGRPILIRFPQDRLHRQANAPRPSGAGHVKT